MRAGHAIERCRFEGQPMGIRLDEKKSI
jgi:hypothetical protein